MHGDQGGIRYQSSPLFRDGDDARDDHRRIGAGKSFLGLKLSQLPRLPSYHMDQLIPTALTIDRFSVFARSNGSDALGVVCEGVPCVAASVDDVVVGVEDGDGEAVCP